VKPLVIAVLLVALVAGGALAAILTGGDEPANPAATTTAEADERTIEQAVADAAAAAEQGDPPPGIEPGDLPGTDELSIDSVRVRGDRGSATLSSGAVVELERSAGRWRITRVRAP